MRRSMQDSCYSTSNRFPQYQQPICMSEPGGSKFRPRIFELLVGQPVEDFTTQSHRYAHPMCKPLPPPALPIRRSPKSQHHAILTKGWQKLCIGSGWIGVPYGLYWWMRGVVWTELFGVTKPVPSRSPVTLQTRNIGTNHPMTYLGISLFIYQATYKSSA